ACGFSTPKSMIVKNNREKDETDPSGRVYLAK
ncbi:MAG: hypothetical protein ACI9LZ_001348, partial [Glaciecola sp.]